LTDLDLRLPRFQFGGTEMRATKSHLGMRQPTEEHLTAETFRLSALAKLERAVV
jgi:hypothetical protein